MSGRPGTPAVLSAGLSRRVAGAARDGRVRRTLADAAGASRRRAALVVSL